MNESSDRRPLWQQIRDVLTLINAAWAAFGILLALIAFVSSRAPLQVTYVGLDFPRMRVLTSNASFLSRQKEIASLSKSNREVWEYVLSATPFRNTDFVQIEVLNTQNRAVRDLQITVQGIFRLYDYGFESDSLTLLGTTEGKPFMTFDSASYTASTIPIDLPANSSATLTVIGRLLLEIPFAITVEAPEIGTLYGSPKELAHGFDLFLIGNKYWLLVAAILLGLRIVAVGVDRLKQRTSSPTSGETAPSDGGPSKDADDTSTDELSGTADNTPDSTDA